MKRIWLAFFLALVSALPVGAEDEVRNLVVKIHATRRAPDLLKPWTKLSPVSVSGTGVVIEGEVILTNAHVVQYANPIYVQPNQSADRIAAHVVAVAPALDLALLRLEDAEFFKERGALPFMDELPRVKDTVNVYGYPTGGSELSVTEGIVSRIEFAEYYYFGSGVRIQVDAALNAGNSGGPAVSQGKLVGLVFSRIRNAQNIGYLIPVEEIRLFLEDVADGKYDGKPQLHDTFQTVENDALRARLRIPKGMGGLMVTEPYRTGDSYPLKEWDVVTHIGGQPIDSEGKVAVRYDLRLSARYLVQKLGRNGAVELTVLRDGRSLKINMPLESQREFVVPYLMNRNPRYFIYGPLVFSPATQDYLERLGSQWEVSLGRQGSPLMARRYDKPAFAGEELVAVVSPMLPHRITKGYDDPNTAVISEVNGIKVKNLKHLVEILRDAKEAQVVFKFARTPSQARETLVFNRSEIVSATEEILNDSGIRSPYSDDLRAVWEKTTKAAADGRSATANARLSKQAQPR
ncbi:MAG TPA: trypsin-like peptidase domain-containing protein [Candidatus Acidoferrales bacterium]|nr:trypsin-like peptidase domain-containing protein [Candidatus Acidoferrales bacterium]